MEPRRTSVRRAGLVALAALLVFGASACSGGTGLVGTPPAATVNGSQISQAQLDEMVSGYRKLFAAQVTAAKASLKEQIASGSTQSTEADLQAEIDRVSGPYALNGYTYPTEGAANQLTQLITREIYEQAVAETGGKITAEDRSAARQSLTQTDASFAKAPKVVQDTYIGISAATAALQREMPADLSDALAAAGDAYEAQLEQAYEQSKASFEQVCFYVIQTSDKASADAALDRIRGGADAATVAGEVAGAAEGAAPAQEQCDYAATVSQALGQDVPEEPGAIAGPVDVGSGFVALVVSSTKTQAFEEAREQIAQQVQDQFTPKAQADITAWLTKVVGDAADVSVDPRFGTWDAATLSVIPPQAPPQPTTSVVSTTAPVAVVPGS